MTKTLTLSAAALLMGTAAFAGMSTPMAFERVSAPMTSPIGDLDRPTSNLILAMSDADGADDDENGDDEGEDGEDDEEEDDDDS